MDEGHEPLLSFSTRMGYKEVSSIMFRKDPATSLNESLNATPPLFN